MLDWTSYNFAISGACTVRDAIPNHCHDGVIEDEIPKAQALNLKPDLVTLTVGANDIGFSDCVEPLLRRRSDGPCSGQQFRDNLANLATHLDTVLGTLRTMYPRTPIVVTRYFDMFPEVPLGQVGSPCFNALTGMSFVAASRRSETRPLAR